MTRVLTRGAMLVGLCLVLWGTLWDLALLYTLLTQGPAGRPGRCLAPPLQNAAAAWANRLSGLLAVFAWAFAIGASGPPRARPRDSLALVEPLAVATTDPAEPAPPRERPERPLFSWSASRHDSFQTCHRRYFFSYYASHDDPEIKRLKRLSALPLWAGSVVHETIEKFLKTHDALPSLEAQEAITRAAVHEDMLQAWRQSEAGPDGFRLFEHEYAQPVDQEDKKILVTTVMRSLKNFFKSPTLREAFAAGKERWLTIEDLVSFHVGPTEVFLRMDLAYREPSGQVVIVDWKTGRREGRFNEIQLAGYALYAAEKGWVSSPGGAFDRARLPRRAALRAAAGRREEARHARAFIEKSASRMRALLLDPEQNLARLEDFPMIDRPRVCRRCNFRRLCFPRAREAANLPRRRPTASAFEVLREPGHRARPRVLGRLLAVAAPGVVDVGERVARSRVDLHVDGLPGGLHRRLEGLHLLGRGPLVVAPEVPEEGALIRAMAAGSVGGAP